MDYCSFVDPDIKKQGMVFDCLLLIIVLLLILTLKNREWFLIVYC